MAQRKERVKQTLKEMFEQRGYKDIREEEDTLLATHQDQTVCAFYTPIQKINMSEIRNKIAILWEMKIPHGIVVYEEGKENSNVNSIVATTVETGMNIELFQADDLQYNPIKHILVPKHEGLSAKESKEFRDTYGAQKLPIILKTDPICRFFDFKKGSVVKITRRDGHVCYRIVR